MQYCQLFILLSVTVAANQTALFMPMNLASVRRFYAVLDQEA